MKERPYLDEVQRRWVRDWWRALQPMPKPAAPKGEEQSDDNAPEELGKTVPLRRSLAGLGRKARAELRRCPDVQALLMEAATYRLSDHLLKLEKEKAFPRFNDDHAAVALVAGVLAHVREDLGNKASLPAALGSTKESERPLLSQMRFQRLLRTRNVDDFYRQLVRAVKLADNKADVAVLANDILAWHCEQHQALPDPNHRLHSRWARDYYLQPQERAAHETANSENQE
ncbi:CRISPR-associated protein, Cse2 family [plant metagenome]